MSHICANDTTNRAKNIVIRNVYTGLSLHLRTDISKVTAHERIQRNTFLQIPTYLQKPLCPDVFSTKPRENLANFFTPQLLFP
jgi:hypothetical protein